MCCRIMSNNYLSGLAESERYFKHCWSEGTTTMKMGQSDFLILHKVFVKESITNTIPELR